MEPGSMMGLGPTGGAISGDRLHLPSTCPDWPHVDMRLELAQRLQ